MEETNEEEEIHGETWEEGFTLDFSEEDEDNYVIYENESDDNLPAPSQSY